jgi:hypothetical protein
MFEFVYLPSDHYWFVADDKSKVFSSSRNTFVDVSDSIFTEWLKNHTPSTINSMEELKNVLMASNVPPYLRVTARQARLALLNAGLLDQVETAVTQAGAEAKIYWDYSTEIHRDSPFIASIGQSLGLTDTQIDDLFVQAATL